MKTGIYLVTSPSGRRYVGSAVNFQRRWTLHLIHLRKRTHHSPALQAAFDKYGESCLIFSKLLVCSKEDLLFYEQRAIDILKPEYNMAPVAGSTLGIKLSEQARANIAAASTGRKHSDETKAKVGASSKGRNVGAIRSQEFKDQVSKKLKGIKRSPETRAKMSAAKRLRDSKAK